MKLEVIAYCGLKLSNLKMNFMDQDTNSHLNKRKVNYVPNDEVKMAFNNLENGLIDLKLGFNETVNEKMMMNNNQKSSFHNQIVEHTVDETDDCKSINIINNNQTNGQINGQMNGQLIQNVASNQNSNLISQSYEFAKVANEFKEKLNDVYTAISYYNKSIELNPYEGRFYVNRSICLQQANQLNEALDDANTAINLMRNARKPYLRKAEIYQVMNKFNDAENCLNHCLKLKTANDIPIEVVQDEIQKIIKTALTKCGISSSIVKQTNHCTSIEQAIDYAFGKQMEEKLNLQHKFAANNAAMMNNQNEKAVHYAIRSQSRPTIPISKSLDSQETDYLTDEELANTPNRKLSINEETMFPFNIQSQSPSIRKDSFTFNQIETARHLLHLNNYHLHNDQALAESCTALANLNNNDFIHKQSTSVGIPIKSRQKRNSLCEPIENGLNAFSLKSLNSDRLSSHFFDSPIERRVYANEELLPIYSKSLGSNLSSLHRNFLSAKHDSVVDVVEPNFKEAVERANVCTNLIGYKGLWLGNVSSSCSRERLISIFRKFGDPILHQLKQSPCAFVKYNNEKSPTEAIQDLHGKNLPDIVHNKNEPIRLHFECNRRQQEENFPKDKMPRKYSNGECYWWRTVGCSLGKACHKIHVPINAAVDFQVWMLRDPHHQEAKNQLLFGAF